MAGEEILVFELISRGDSKRDECGRELFKGNFLRKEGPRGLCIDCADLGHLVFVARGDACITRRASKYSPLRAIVLRFSRSRKRYERQGILVAEEALARAEEECLDDAELRERRRQVQSKAAPNATPTTSEPLRMRFAAAIPKLRRMRPIKSPRTPVRSIRIGSAVRRVRRTSIRKRSI